jgi:hypothetical protein
VVAAAEAVVPAQPERAVIDGTGKWWPSIMFGLVLGAWVATEFIAWLLRCVFRRRHPWTGEPEQ